MKNTKCQLCNKNISSRLVYEKVSLKDHALYEKIKGQFKRNPSVLEPYNVNVPVEKFKVELYEVCEECLDNPIFELTDDLYNNNNVLLSCNENIEKHTITMDNKIDKTRCFCCEKETKTEILATYVEDELIEMFKENPNLINNITADEIYDFFNKYFTLVNVCSDCVHSEIEPKVKFLYSKGILLNEYYSYTENNEDFNEKDELKKVNKSNEDNKQVMDDRIILAYGENLMSSESITKIKSEMIIGRDKELDSLINILSKRDKNNPIIVGPSGVGKTSLVYQLCLRIYEGKVPSDLLNKKIYEVRISELVSGTKYRGDFEQKLNTLLNAIKGREDIIIFFDEIHQIVGAGAGVDMISFKDIIKPALSKGELTCIGATTTDDYKKTIEKDSSLKRRFQPVFIQEPTHEECVALLKEASKKYQKYHHLIKIKDNILDEIVYLSDRYITDRFLPDKALDLLDQACALLKVQNDTFVIDNYLKRNKEMLKHVNEKEFVSIEDKEELIEELKSQNKVLKNDLILTSDIVHKVIKDWTGIDVSKLNQDNLGNLQTIDEKLSKKVIGQQHVTDTIAKYIKRAKVGMNSPNKPLGVYLLVGPTGTGKTELAKVTNELLAVGKEMIRFDFSEYGEKHQVSKLIGAPPGYVGYEEGGLLTERVKRSPNSVILLDEIEKAHPDILNILLQIFDEGFLTDNQGQRIDFKNTMIFMTSNIIVKSNEIKSSIGFTINNQESIVNEKEKKLLQSLNEKGLKKELLNRIDEILLFNELTEDTIHNICINKINEKIKFITNTNKYIESCEYDDSVIKFLTVNGFNKEYGARPLNRAIERYFSDSITEYLVQQPLTKNKKYKLKVTVNKENEKELLVISK